MTTILQIDSFASRPFTGNPAAVCVMDGEPPTAWMQDVAMEMNLSETAFTWPQGDGWHLKWFTPLEEVDLCGHATLAAAHALWEEGHLGSYVEAVFHTRSGELRARRERNEVIAMDFPAEPAEPCESPVGLAEALGFQPVAVYKNRFDYLIELPTEGLVHSAAPNMTQLAAITERGVIITARAEDPGVDFVSRFFAPAVGIPEDPVTGSAHCALGPFWSARFGKSALSGLQVSRRTGLVGVEILNTGRVILRGRAITVLKGELLADAASSEE